MTPAQDCAKITRFVYNSLIDNIFAKLCNQAFNSIFTNISLVFNKKSPRLLKSEGLNGKSGAYLSIVIFLVKTLFPALRT
jgi:hypothetical protein